LQKIKSVHEFFKKQNNAVLLWRPHPLLKSTIKSMLPWLEQEYAEIVNEYKYEGYGIYDDSQDLNRAIALSDICYGDWSSVAKLFGTAGKPALWQMIEMVQQYITALYGDGNFVWFMDCYNTLYKHSKQSKETEYIGVIPAQNFWASVRIVANNNKLYFAPYYKNSQISVFDIVQKSFEQIDFKDDCKYDGKFRNVVSFKNFVYFIPHEFPAIMRLNTDTKEIEYFSECIDDVLKQPISKLQESWKNIFWNFCIANEEIAIIIHGLNAVMFFNMETCNYGIKNIGEKSEQYNDICYDGQNYYLSTFHKAHIVKWNKQANKISKIKIPSFFRRENERVSFSVQYLNEYVWLFPVYANNAYKINTSTNEVTELPELTEHFKAQNSDWYYNLVSASENSIYASTQHKGIVEYNTNTAKLNFINLPGFEIEPALLSWLCNYDNLKNGLNVNTETANSGKRIWEYFRRAKQ
jgi:hypothetical protein